jgi:hypothetical protein
MQLMYHRDHSEKNLLIYDENVEFDVFSNNESAVVLIWVLFWDLVLVRSLVDESFLLCLNRGRASLPCMYEEIYDAQKPYLERGGT